MRAVDDKGDKNHFQIYIKELSMSLFISVFYSEVRSKEELSETRRKKFV
jgi:hypothetical protein